MPSQSDPVATASSISSGLIHVISAVCIFGKIPWNSKVYYLKHPTSISPVSDPNKIVELSGHWVTAE